MQEYFGRMHVCFGVIKFPALSIRAHQKQRMHIGVAPLCVNYTCFIHLQHTERKLAADIITFSIKAYTKLCTRAKFTSSLKQPTTKQYWAEIANARCGKEKKNHISSHSAALALQNQIAQQAQRLRHPALHVFNTTFPEVQRWLAGRLC